MQDNIKIISTNDAQKATGMVNNFIGSLSYEGHKVASTNVTFDGDKITILIHSSIAESDTRNVSERMFFFKDKSEAALEQQSADLFYKLDTNQRQYNVTDIKLFNTTETKLLVIKFDLLPQTDRDYQVVTLKNLIEQAMNMIYFKPNPKYSKFNFNFINYRDVLDRNIRITGTQDHTSHEGETVIKYNTAEELVDDGWRLD